MSSTIGIGAAAEYLGIAPAELIALYRQDLVPWIPADGLPRFDLDALEAFRPRVRSCLREARAIAADIDRRSRRVPAP